MSVIGSISIKDNVTATLRIIKKEQTSFREDVKKTREEMEKTWKEKYQANATITAVSLRFGICFDGLLDGLWARPLSNVAANAWWGYGASLLLPAPAAA